MCGPRVLERWAFGPRGAGSEEPQRSKLGRGTSRWVPLSRAGWDSERGASLRVALMFGA
ncbi:hypothetical protein KY284_001853 [Solanum tuberosum]|nr:hypothetical protein KY284_001853 [Solanum tuberosum]